jgi:hypothetical protein
LNYIIVVSIVNNKEDLIIVTDYYTVALRVEPVAMRLGHCTGALEHKLAPKLGAVTRIHATEEWNLGQG